MKQSFLAWKIIILQGISALKHTINVYIFKNLLFQYIPRKKNSFTNIFTTSCLQIFRYIILSFIILMITKQISHIHGGDDWLFCLKIFWVINVCWAKLINLTNGSSYFSFHHNLYMKKIDSIHMSCFFFLFPFPLFFKTIDLCFLKRLENQANNWNNNFLQFIIIWVSL